MTYYATGGSPALEHRSEIISVATPAKMSAAVRVRVTNNTNKAGTGTFARIGNISGGISWSFATGGGQTLFNANCRVLINGASSIRSTSADPLYIVEGTWYEFITVVDTVTKYIQIYKDNVLWLEVEGLEGETWAIWGTNIIGLLAGPAVTDKAVEFSHLYGWIGEALSEAECLSFSIANDDPTELTAAPTHGWVPTGATNADAATIPAVFGTAALVQTAGAEYPDAGYPYFVSYEEEEENTVGPVSYTATGRGVQLTGALSGVTGTLYFVGDLSENFAGMPTAENIRDGFLDDGETDATHHYVIARAGETSFSQAVGNMPAGAEHTFFFVFDKDDEGDFSEITTLTVETKRLAIGPTGEDKQWYKSDGTVRISEEGIELLLAGTGTVVHEFFTNSDGEAEVDITEWANGLEDSYPDIGDTVSFDVRFSDGEILAIRNVEIFEGA